MLSSIPAGSTITDVYYALPAYYGPGDRFETNEAAVTEGLSRVRASDPRHTFTVDLRWAVDFPVGGGEDTVVERTVWTVQDAGAYLRRVARFAR